MTAEMPEQVAPVPGATSVCFPWTHASSAIAVLAAVQATLGEQLGARPLMAATLADWTGRYRNDFDPVFDRLNTTGASLVESLAARASTVVTAAEDANDEQIAANRRALVDLVTPW